jgi:hypothetical protein
VTGINHGARPLDLSGRAQSLEQQAVQLQPHPGTLPLIQATWPSVNEMAGDPTVTGSPALPARSIGATMVTGQTPKRPIPVRDTDDRSQRPPVGRCSVRDDAAVLRACPGRQGPDR